MLSGVACVEPGTSKVKTEERAKEREGTRHILMLQNQLRALPVKLTLTWEKINPGVDNTKYVPCEKTILLFRGTNEWKKLP